MIFLWTWGLLREDCISMGWEKEKKSIQSMKFKRYKLDVKLKPLHHFLDIILINFKSYNWNLCLFTAEPRMWIYINWFQMSIAEIIGDLCTNKTLHDKSLKTWQFIRVCVECVWRIWQSCNMCVTKCRPVALVSHDKIFFLIWKKFLNFGKIFGL